MTKATLYFAVGDALNECDPLGIFQKSGGGSIYETYAAYDKKILKIIEDIHPDDSWTKILRTLETVFAPDLSQGNGVQISPDTRKEMVQAARRIKAAILQSPAYYPELLQCTEEEKEACLQTVVNLYRLRDYIYCQGVLGADDFAPWEEAPFFAACLRGEISYYCDLSELPDIKRLLRQYLMAEGACGGEFLEDAVIMEGLLFYVRFLDNIYPTGRAEWGKKLCGALKGLFGTEFENRVEDAIERESKAWEERPHRGEAAIFFESPSVKWPQVEGREIEESRAAHIMYWAVEDAVRECGLLPELEEPGPEAARKITEAASQIRPDDNWLKIAHILEIIFGGDVPSAPLDGWAMSRDSWNTFVGMACHVKTALLENPVYYSRRLQCPEEEKDACLKTVARLSHLWMDVLDNGLDAAKRWADEEADPFFKTCLLDFAENPEPQNLRKKLLMHLAMTDCGSGGFLNNVLILEGLVQILADKEQGKRVSRGAEDSLVSVLKALFGTKYLEKVEHVLECEFRADRKQRRLKDPSPSFIPAFDRLTELTQEQCAQILEELPENTLVYAMKGAGGQVIRHLMESLPEARLRQVEDDLEIRVNVRLEDVKEAQQAIWEKAKRILES